MSRPVDLARGGAVLAALAAALVALCLLSPLRPTSGDTVAGRLGAAVLRCAGSFDLARIDWIGREAARGRAYYYALPDEDGHVVSVFGPAPSVAGAAALLDFGPGATISDDTLRRRERDAAAVLVALAAVLVWLATRAGAGRARATAVAATAALSFAGLATLGQGLWQATVALPLLAAALATLCWAERAPRLRLATPALVALAVMIRPTLAPLALGLGVAWWLAERRWRARAVAAGLALAAVAPLVAWNAIHWWSPLPIGQWRLNHLLAGDVVRPSHALVGLAGLLVSPARGLVWFAPVAIVGVARGIAAPRALPRLVAWAVVAQLALMAVFFKWSGGLAFGPRLLAEATWLGAWLALAPGAGPRTARLAAACAAVTIAVGLLGLWRFHPDQWEMRRLPEAHPSALWDVTDSPLVALFGPTHFAHETPDSPRSGGLVCEHGRLGSLPPRAPR